MTAWDFFAWVGIAVVSVLGLYLVHEAVEMVLVGRIGWTRLEELGFWRSIPAAIKRRSE